MKYKMANKIINTVVSFEIYHITQDLIKKSMHRNRNKRFRTLSLAIPGDLVILGQQVLLTFTQFIAGQSLVRSVCVNFCAQKLKLSHVAKITLGI